MIEDIKYKTYRYPLADFMGVWGFMGRNRSTNTISKSSPIAPVQKTVGNGGDISGTLHMRCKIWFLPADMLYCRQYDYFKSKKPTWRSASYTMMAAELDKFKERAAALSSIGILMRPSG